MHAFPQSGVLVESGRLYIEQGGRRVRSVRRRVIRGPVLVALLGFVVLVLLLATPASASAVSFPDVNDGDWFAEAVETLSAAGIVEGRDDGTFRPHDSITRAEFAVLLSRCLGLSQGGSHPFTDFPSGAWFEPAVGALFQLGLTAGVSATEFDPYGKLSRQQAVSFVIRALAYRLSAQPVEGLDLTLAPSEVESWLQGFPDRALVADVHRSAVANAYRLQVVSGQSDGLFFPLGTATRAQSVGMLYAALFQTPVPLTEPPAPVPSVLGFPSASVGSQGEHVMWLEQRLTELTYRPGPVDGVFDDRTRHAVIAFQKWEGLSRDGQVGSQTWVRLTTATRPMAMRSGSGVWIEVNKAKQVFLYVENGTVTRTLPTSTGRSFTYRSEPYTVQRKPIADGPRYRALYINPGYVLAIHGYPSVPTYPASDGCIRVPKRDMDDLRERDATNPMIPDGTKVYIY